jgi:hypothetical protein
MTAPAMTRTSIEAASADLAAAEAEHTRLVGAAVSRSNRPGEHDLWGDVRAAAGVVHQARAALTQAEKEA